MIILDATNRSLEAVLGEAATTQLPIVSSWADNNNTAPSFTPGVTPTVSNSTTGVTIVAAPAASTQRHVKYISVYNADNIPHNVTIRYNDNTTLRIMFKCVLAVGEMINYMDGQGFQVLDVYGGRKTAGSTNTSTSGTVALDFGSFPGTFTAVATVTGVSSITASSKVILWVDGTVTATAAHSQDEHLVGELFVFPTNIVVSTGFDIVGQTDHHNAGRLYGTYNVSWRVD